jgi:hypothetical protein
VADDEKLLYKFHDIFNRVFFKGALTWEKCTLRIILKEDVSGKWRSEAKGVSIKLGSTPDDCRTLIRIYVRLEEHSEKRLLGYMSTLLHEMTHCLAYNYSCGCSSRTSSPNSPWGVTGHGPGWVKLFCEFYDFAMKLLNILLNLGISDSVAIEIYESENEQL